MSFQVASGQESTICRFGDDETAEHYLAYCRMVEAAGGSMKRDMLAHIIDILLSCENKIDIAHQVFEHVNKKSKYYIFQQIILKVTLYQNFNESQKMECYTQELQPTSSLYWLG